jgi:acetoin:2,6-dichlorophenolindophenol oxidoreductase subunit beta
MTCIESLNSALNELLEEMPEVVIFGEDLLDPYGGAFKVTRGLQAKFPQRVLTTPISEGALTGLANGMALRGLRPVLEIMFGDFLSLCMDQIVNHGAKFRTMYNESVTVPVTIRTPVGGGRGYGPTHSQCIEKLFMGVPEIRIVAPSVYCQAGEVLKQAVRDDRLVLFIEHKLLYALQLFPESPGITAEIVMDDDGYPVALVRNYESGSPDVTLITYGGMSRLVAPFLERMAGEEIKILACIPTLIKPLPFDVLCRAAKESGRVVLAEEGGLSWGWGAEVAARLHKTLFKELRAPVTRVGAADLAIPAARALERAVLPDEAAMESAVVEVLQ